MGLAASQARFLGLTARKSNTEYEGQQVNQQRTALANESASLYSQLTNLTVPTPPDITNYYNTEYSFSYNGKTYTMTSLPVLSENEYTLSLSYLDTEIGYTESTLEQDALSDSDMVATGSTLAKYEKLGAFFGIGQNGLTEDTPVYKYTDSEKGTYYGVYATKTNDKGEQYQELMLAKYYSNSVTRNIENIDGVKIGYSSTGDISTISMALTEGHEVAVSTTSTADDQAYDEAMNTYRKEYSEYEKTMAQINAKTEVLQQQDKTLELRLNQLDTEQNAIATEMDAVQKVIEKNVESTFKTFG